MRSINRQRLAVETEGRHHAVVRGVRGKLHFENMPRLQAFLACCLKLSVLYVPGHRNVLKTHLCHVEFTFDDLPEAFDNTRILFISDFHIDGTNGLVEKILEEAGALEYDFCVFGGDYTFRSTRSELAVSRMKQIAKDLTSRTKVYAALGNHDRYSMAETLSEAGVEMLINDNTCIEKQGRKIYIAGLDDCHYFGADDINLADDHVPIDAFKIMISHSPEAYIQAAYAGYDLFLAGHTHGGQVCLPGQIPVVSGTSVPSDILKGKWKFHNMSGYTSRGVGASGIAVRFFCPPEMNLITLKCRTAK